MPLRHANVAYRRGFSLIYSCFKVCGELEDLRLHVCALFSGVGQAGKSCSECSWVKKTKVSLELREL